MRYATVHAMLSAACYLLCYLLCRAVISAMRAIRHFRYCPTTSPVLTSHIVLLLTEDRELPEARCGTTRKEMLNGKKWKLISHSTRRPVLMQCTMVLVHCVRYECIVRCHQESGGTNASYAGTHLLYCTTRGGSNALYAGTYPAYGGTRIRWT
eukprot:2746123-Rhodomonas_salina.2